MQIWYLKYLLPETQEGRADQCADNNELSGLSVQTTNTGENLVIQMTHSVAWTFFFCFFFCPHQHILSWFISQVVLIVSHASAHMD